MSLAGRTILMSGGSRGVGLAIALRAARDGANVALIAKTAEPHPKLEGTIHTAAKQIEDAGGQALPIVGDIRDADLVAQAAEQAAAHFGAIDIVVNNASAIALMGTTELPVKAFDLMQSINVRGTWVLTRAAIPHLERSDHAHILTLSPPLNLAPRWLAQGGYTISKYSMSMLTLGWAEELRERGIAANCLWPRTLIATAAVQNLLGGDEAMARARTPEIYADSAYAILNRPPAEATGNCYIDDEVLAEEGVTDLEPYRAGTGDAELQLDIFLDD